MTAFSWSVGCADVVVTKVIDGPNKRCRNDWATGDNGWEIAVPAAGLQLPGVKMAGFRSQSRGVTETAMVPHPAFTIVINLGAETVVKVTDDQSVQTKCGSAVVGLGVREAHGRGTEVECLQVRLTPLAAHSLLGDPQGLAGGVVGLEDVWGAGARALEDRLRGERSWERRFEMLTRALEARLDAGRPVDPEIQFAWHAMAASRGTMKVDALASEIGWSRKRMWSRFGAQVGLSPKRLSRLLRFDHASHRLAAGIPSAQVAADCGYADQSHLHRETQALAGMTPHAVAKAGWLTVDDRAWGTFVQDSGSAWLPRSCP